MIISDKNDISKTNEIVSDVRFSTHFYLEHCSRLNHRHVFGICVYSVVHFQFVGLLHRTVGAANKPLATNQVDRSNIGASLYLYELPVRIYLARHGSFL